MWNYNMGADEVHVGDYGTVITLTFYDDTTLVDISGATTKTVYLKKPNGSVLTKTGVFVTDGSDGKLKYTLVDGDIDMDGLWKIQGYIATASGQWYSDEKDMEVHPNLA